MAAIIKAYLNGAEVDIAALRGQKGDTGDDGHTPVKGVDYFTTEEKQQIVQDVLDSLPYYDGEIEVV